ncbi:hypothetical protein JCM10207_002121 [Rhodosporidiobolus poonsookiae]
MIQPLLHCLTDGSPSSIHAAILLVTHHRERDWSITDRVTRATHEVYLAFDKARKDLKKSKRAPNYVRWKHYMDEAARFVGGHASRDDTEEAKVLAILAEIDAVRQEPFPEDPHWFPVLAGALHACCAESVQDRVFPWITPGYIAAYAAHGGLAAQALASNNAQNPAFKAIIAANQDAKSRRRLGYRQSAIYGIPRAAFARGV